MRWQAGGSGNLSSGQDSNRDLNIGIVRRGSMKILFIGGTGNISTTVSRRCIAEGIELYLLNRGIRSVDIPGAEKITGDIHDEPAMAALLQGQRWDVVVNWIAYKPEEIERDFRLFAGRTHQYIFISSASVYQKPPSHPVITESTPRYNPFWQYSRDKIACEEKLHQYYRENDFPITIVRPSLTYDTVIPVPIGGWTEYTIVDRIKKGLPVIVQGDGTSLWTITHADDFALGFCGLLGHQQATGQSFHITSDELLTWNQIFQALADAAGSPLKMVHVPSDFIARFDDFHTGNLLGDKSNSVIFDNTKIKTFVPAFIATIPFNKGIRRTLEWFEAKPERMVIQQSTHQFMDRVISAYQRAFEGID
jgi:nucleoside-diphosphate-sugar epimerase